MVLMLDSSFVTGLSVGLAIGYLCTLIQKKLSISRIDGENTITEPADVVVGFNVFIIIMLEIIKIIIISLWTTLSL